MDALDRFINRLNEEASREAAIDAAGAETRYIPGLEEPITYALDRETAEHLQSQGINCYTLDEIILMGGYNIPPALQQFIHQAKQIFDGTVERVIPAEDDIRETEKSDTGHITGEYVTLCARTWDTCHKSWKVHPVTLDLRKWCSPSKKFCYHDINRPAPEDKLMPAKEGCQAGYPRCGETLTGILCNKDKQACHSWVHGFLPGVETPPPGEHQESPVTTDREHDHSDISFTYDKKWCKDVCIPSGSSGMSESMSRHCGHRMKRGYCPKYVGQVSQTEREPRFPSDGQIDAYISRMTTEAEILRERRKMKQEQDQAMPDKNAPVAAEAHRKQTVTKSNKPKTQKATKEALHGSHN